MARALFAPVLLSAAVLGVGNSSGNDTTHHPALVTACLAIAAVLSIGLPWGQTIRCLRRKSSEDVSILGWLSDAAANGFALAAALLTHSWWWAVWQGLGVIEYATPAAIAWWYRSNRTRASDPAAQ